jgi:hypothetical protein
VIVAVVFDDKPGRAVEEIGPAERETRLHLRPRKTGVDEEPSEAGLHGRLRRLGVIVESAESEANSSIGKDEVLDRRQPTAEIGEGSHGGRCAEATDPAHVAAAQLAVAHEYVTA